MIGTYRRYKKENENWSTNIYSNTGFIRTYILPELGEQIKKAGTSADITADHIRFGNLQFVCSDVSPTSIRMELQSINTDNDTRLIEANSGSACLPYLAGTMNPSILQDYVIYISPGQNFVAINYIVTENALILWNPYESDLPALCMFILNYAGSQVTYAIWATDKAPNPGDSGSLTSCSTASLAVNKLGNATPIMTIASGGSAITAGSRMAINKGELDVRCFSNGLATCNTPHLTDDQHDLHLWTPLIFSFQELLIEGSLSTKNMCNNSLLISDKTYHLDKSWYKSGYHMIPSHSPKLGTLNGRKCVVLDPGQFFPDYTNISNELFDFSIVYIYE